jgi:hypothetical protein
LSLAVKAVNELPNVDGFIPMQLVYGIIPKIPIFGSKSSYVRQKERMECLKIAQDEYGRCDAERRLKLAQNVRGPSLQELNE